MLVSLRNYSNYSICESNIKIDDLVNFASKNNLSAIGLTDYKLLSGSLEFSIKCQKAGIQPIIGLDIDYVSILGHSKRVTFLSKSEEGFKNLNILSTEVNTNNNFLLNENNIKDYANGNILILGGLYSYFDDIPINQKNLNKVLNEIQNLKEIFKNDLFFEYDPNLNNIF
jgi:DNA polymerase-3 subunit alpha